MKIKYFLILHLVLFFCFVVTTHSYSQPKVDPRAQGHQERPAISYYTCGMHPEIKVAPEQYNQGSTACPICQMSLMPVYPSEDSGQTPPKGNQAADIVAQVQIKLQEAQLAGIATELIQKQHLFKEIRTVGTIAYDPQLAVAQEEFLASVRTYDKSKTSVLAEITEGAQSLVGSARKKLLLLGLGPEQIDALEKDRQVQEGLILPEKSMWVYGDLYEYDLPWVKAGDQLKVTTIALPGVEFKGEIASMNPVIDPMTRSLRFRARVENPELRLKPQMNVDIRIESMYMNPEGEHMVLAVLADTVLQTGERNIVWVLKEHENFEGHEVKLGPQAVAVTDGSRRSFYPVLSGLKEGDRVVTKGNFLVDSQSRITGVAASAYGGALDKGEMTSMPGMSGHQH